MNDFMTDLSDLFGLMRRKPFLAPAIVILALWGSIFRK